MTNDVAPLGEGRFGICVVGQDKATKSIFAMKRNNRDDMEQIESICWECNMLARLCGGHDNIVQFFGAVIEENEREYPPRLCKMFMEFAESKLSRFAWGRHSLWLCVCVDVLATSTRSHADL